MTDCELCNLERKTAWHYEDETIVICNCLTCGIPMVVFRSHGPRPVEEYIHAMQKIKELYGERLQSIRKESRKILDHVHWHLNLKG